MTEHDHLVLGRLFARLLADEHFFTWLDGDRLILDDTCWDLTEEEKAVIRKAEGKE